MKVIKTDAMTVPVKAWVDGVAFEEEAQRQLMNAATLPFLHKHVAVMPDCHSGIGCTVGSVIATKGAIVPAFAGVDLGCGMTALKLNLTASDLPDSLTDLFHLIEKAVPHGGPGMEGAWEKIPEIVYKTFDNTTYTSLIKKYPKIESRFALNQLGTLGTGNHFVEICLDESQNVWIMLHSGSRGLGNNIGRYFIDKAREEMSRWFINLPDKDLAYLPEGSQYYHDYLDAVSFAQNYALLNRSLMLKHTLETIQSILPRARGVDTAVSCHHNYVEMEHHFGKNVWVTRKGAVRARKTDLAIIPGAMGKKSFIVKGKGNAESFDSCSHGAGRLMSRTEAKRRFTLEDHVKDTEGVECRKDLDVIDETPKAYKDLDAVMNAQSDLVEIVHTLKGIICVKG